MNKFREDYQKYMDAWGLVQPTPGTTSQNGIRFTACYIIALYQHKQAVEGEKERLRLLMHACEPEMGILCRHPGDGEQEGPDDYFAALTTDAFLGTGFATRFLIQSGRQAEVIRLPASWHEIAVFNIVYRIPFLNRRHYTNSTRPDVFSYSGYFMRFPALFAHAKVVVERKLTLMDRLSWNLALLNSVITSRKNQDAHALTWFMVKATRGRHIPLSMRITRAVWRWAFKRKFPDGYGQLLAEYFQNPDHPSAVYLRGDYGA